MLARSNRPGARTLRTLATQPHNLPAQPTPLIGRAADIAAVRARLREDDVRLLTLTGSPGTGKTRLAHAVAAEMIDDFADGVWFVALETVRDPDGVVAAMAQTLGVREAGAEPLRDLLTAYLAERHLLLVLDNFEQVLDAGVVVADLLAACPRLTVLVTSRAPLRLRWEYEFPVAPLALPPAGGSEDASHGLGERRRPDSRLVTPDSLRRYAAVQLFIQRAQAVMPAFRLTDENAGDVAAICIGLDGLPLAIELAAARVKQLPTHAIRDRLEHRFAFLIGGARDLPARHQTLRAAIDWSHDLLTPHEQALFRRLGIFAGGWTLEAAEAIAVEAVDDASQPSGASVSLPVVEGLAALLDHSLLRMEAEPSPSAPQQAGAPRYPMLETLREYALDQLVEHSELSEVRHRHAAFYLALAETAEPHLTGADQLKWLARLETEHDNLRAALAWVLERGEGELGLRLAAALGRFWSIHGHVSEGRRWLRQALSVGQGAPLRRQAQALRAAAGLAWDQGDFSAARVLAEESLALQQELGDKREMAVSLNELGRIAYRQSDFATARARFEEALILVRELGDTWRIAVALHNLGSVAAEQGDYATARSGYEESLKLRRALEDTRGIAESLHALGYLALTQGDHAAGRALSAESLALRRELGDRRGIAYALANLASAARLAGDTAAGAPIEESLTIRRELGDKHGVATSLNILGLVAWDRDDHAAARAAWEESLTLSRELGSTQGVSFCFVNLARLAAVRAEPARAARLLGAAEALREAIGSAIVPAEREDYDRIVAAVRAALGEEAFATAWATGRALPHEEAFAEALVSPESEAAAQHAPSPVPTATRRPPNALTAREAEVVRLLAQGLTNRQIAAELVISDRTADAHVANILGKLGFHTRAQIAAWATERGLHSPTGE